MSGRTRTRLAAALVPLALVVAGCGSGADDEPGAAATSRATEPPPERTVKPGRVTIPTKVPNRPAKRAAVELTGCAATDDGWAASGTATAGQGRARTFVISVFFTTDQATVVEWGRTRVTVPAGERADWQVGVELPVQGELRCVLRGVG